MQSVSNVMTPTLILMNDSSISIDLVHTSHEIDFVKVSEFEKFERVDTFTNTHRMHKTQGESLDFLGIDVNSSCSIRISIRKFSSFSGNSGEKDYF